MDLIQWKENQVAISLNIDLKGVGIIKALLGFIIKTSKRFANNHVFDNIFPVPLDENLIEGGAKIVLVGNLETRNGTRLRFYKISFQTILRTLLISYFCMTIFDYAAI